MSRIHDALKKAREERIRQAGGVDDILGDVATRLSDSVKIATQLEDVSSAEDSSAKNTLFPSFEELLKHCSHPKWKVDPGMSVFEGGQANRAGAERFRTLRSRLCQIAGTRTLRSFVITSSIAAEGKTFVAANLAQSILRQPDRRVLLIDADLRAPRLHLFFGAPKEPGLAEYLRGEVDEYTIIQNGLSSNLCLIPSGKEVSNPSELVLSDRMKRLLELATPVFDWVILDSPPALPVHDASLLADLCDGVLFVVRASATDFELVTKASSKFREKAILGIVLNGVNKNELYGREYYKYNGKV